MKSLYKIVSYITGIVLLVGAALLKGTNFHTLPVAEIVSVYLICLILCPYLGISYTTKLWSGLLGTLTLIMLSGGILAVLVIMEYLFGITASIVISASLPAVFSGIILVNRNVNPVTETTDSFYIRGVKPSAIKQFIFCKYAYGTFFRFSGIILSIISVIILVGKALLYGTSYTVQNMISLGIIIVAAEFVGYLFFIFSGSDHKKKEVKKTGLLGIIVFGLLILSVALVVAYLFFVRQHIPVSEEIQTVSDTLSVLFIYSGIAAAGGWIAGILIGLILGIMGKIGKNLTALLNGFCVIPPYITVAIVLSFTGGGMGTFIALGFYVLVYSAVVCSESFFALKNSREARFYLKKSQYFRSFISPVFISEILKGLLSAVRNTLYNIVIVAAVSVLPLMTGWREDMGINSWIAASVSIVLLIFNILCFIVKGERQNG